MLAGDVEFGNAAVILKLEIGQFLRAWLAASDITSNQNRLISHFRLVVEHLINIAFPWTLLPNLFRSILKLHNEACFQWLLRVLCQDLSRLKVVKRSALERVAVG